MSLEKFELEVSKFIENKDLINNSGCSHCAVGIICNNQPHWGNIFCGGFDDDGKYNGETPKTYWERHQGSLEDIQTKGLELIEDSNFSKSELQEIERIFFFKAIDYARINKQETLDYILEDSGEEELDFENDEDISMSIGNWTDANYYAVESVIEYIGTLWNISDTEIKKQINLFKNA